jgi:hypothetical protein
MRGNSTRSWPGSRGVSPANVNLLNLRTGFEGDHWIRQHYSRLASDGSSKGYHDRNRMNV